MERCPEALGETQGQSHRVERESPGMEGGVGTSGHVGSGVSSDEYLEMSHTPLGAPSLNNRHQGQSSRAPFSSEMLPPRRGIDVKGDTAHWVQFKCH